jgi:hypothetical protein
VSTWAQINEVTAIVPEGFQVTFTVTQAVGVPVELFVWSLSAGAYDHVATLSDLDRYPNTLLDATVQEQAFYRQATARRTFQEVAQVELFRDHVRTRLREICAARNIGQPFYPENNTFVVGSDP